MKQKGCNRYFICLISYESNVHICSFEPLLSSLHLKHEENTHFYFFACIVSLMLLFCYYYYYIFAVKSTTSKNTLSVFSESSKMCIGIAYHHHQYTHISLLNITPISMRKASGPKSKRIPDKK